MLSNLKALRTTVLASGLLISATAAHAAELTVVHGIPGQELGADASLAVDVSVNGACALQNFQFGGITDPISLDAGTYNVEVRLADDTQPCSGTLAIARSISLALGENASAVAHFTTEGSIQLTKFTNDVRAPASGKARIVARHLADAPDVDIPLIAGGMPSGSLDGLSFGQQGKVDVDTTDYVVSVNVAGTDVVALGPYHLNVQAGTGYFAYVVGSVSGGTLVPLLQIIDL